jgi:hypothetical protein
MVDLVVDFHNMVDLGLDIDHTVVGFQVDIDHTVVVDDHKVADHKVVVHMFVDLNIVLEVQAVDILVFHRVVKLLFHFGPFP